MWWFRRPHAKYSALPLAAGGVDETKKRRTNCSLHRATIYIAVIALIISGVSLARFAVHRLHYFTPIPSIRPPKSFEIRRPPQGGHATPNYNATVINDAQETAFRFSSRPNVRCGLKLWHETRYASLRPLGPESKTVLLALNLVNAASILPSLLVEMPVLLRFLGPHNVHVSVYENGSEDFTPELLVSLAQILDAVGTSFTIVSRGKTEIMNKDFDHRIESLVKLRNKALLPLYDRTISDHMPGGKFDEVLVMNDIIWCPVDVLEVLYQKRKTGAHQACSVDWDWNMRVVYDRWVLRAMSGRTWYDTEDLIKYWHDDRPLNSKTAPQALPLDPDDRARFDSLKPLQVFSCWNGMSVFSASAFLEHGIRFRWGHSDHHGDGSPKEPTDIVSECYLTSVDLWKKDMGKIVLASRSRVAYSIDDYDIYRKDWVVGEIEDLPALVGSEHFDWVDKPPEKVAMQDLGWWENDVRWAPWDEP